MAYYDEAQRKWVFTDRPDRAEPVVPEGASIFERRRFQEQQQQQRTLAEESEQFRARGERPLVATSVGQGVSEIGKAVANAGLGLVTDTADMALMGADAVRWAASPLTGDDLRGTFDDSDNPLTKWRRQTFRMETEVGQAASNLLRIGTTLIAFPKMLPKLGGMAVGRLAKGAKAAEEAGQVASKVQQIGSTLGKVAGKIGGALEVPRPQAVSAALKSVRASELTSKAGKTLGRIAENDSYLYATLRDFSKAHRGASRINDVGKVEVLGQTMRQWEALKIAAGKYTPRGDVIKTFAHALAWDAFVAFNVAGEGDYSMDETFTDSLASSNNPYLRGLAWKGLVSSPEDSALVAKGKQMLEGLAFGATIESALHLYRVSKYASAWQKASGSERAAIISAFEGEAQDIGAGLAKSQGLDFESDVQQSLARTGGLASDVSAKATRMQALKDLLSQPPQAAAPQPGVSAETLAIAREAVAKAMGRTPGEPAASAVSQQAAPPSTLTYEQWLQSRDVLQSLGPTLPPDSEVQAALRQMENRGVLQPGAGPAERVGVPEELLPAAREGVAEAMQAIPDDRQAYEQWLQSQSQRGGEIVPSPGGQLLAPPPVVTPQAYREAFYRDAYRAAKEALVYVQGEGNSMVRLFQDAKALAPSSRMSALELLKQIGVRLNDVGMQNAADSVMTDWIQERGLKEGWIVLDPETFTMTVRRDIAADLDSGDEAIKQATALDSIAAEQEMLGTTGTVSGLEGVDMNPAFIEDAMSAGARADAMDYQAQLEMVQAAAAARPGMSDAEVVQRAFGSRLDDLVTPPIVEKLPNRPGFGVYSQEGELLKESVSQRGAEAFAKQEAKAQRGKFIEQAKGMIAQEQGVKLSVQYGQPILDSDIVGKVKITSSQARALDALLKPEARDLYSRLFPKLSELVQAAKSSRQIEMTQGQMSQLVERIRAAAQGGLITPSQKLALNNLVQRLQDSAELLAPEARAQRDVSNLVDAMTKLSKHGEYCDFL